MFGSGDPLILQRKYADQLRSSVERFRIVEQNPYKSNFRCNICGDSKKSKTKARAYIYTRDGELHFKCQNCGVAHKFVTYLQNYFPQLYSEYTWEIVSEKVVTRSSNNVSEATKIETWKAEQTKYNEDISKFATKPFQNFDPLSSLLKVSQLDDDNPCRKYVLSRQIPTKYHYKLFYTDMFFHWINSYRKGKFGDQALKHDEPRLVIPFLDQKGFCFGVTGRSLAEEATTGRYITILFDPTKPKIFGLDEIDFSRRVYILEGAIDSTFIENSLAFNGIDGNIDIDDYVLVLDNEPRNREVLNKYAAYIARGSKICIWPGSVTEKDINNMVLAGRSPKEIQQIIDSNTHQGLLATLAFNNWKKLETK